MTIHKHVLLAPHTSFRIGGPATYFIIIQSVKELAEALMFAEEEHLSVCIIGRGSNTLFSDEGFKGLVIKIASLGVLFEKKGETVFVTATAGENWDELVERSIREGCFGMENLSGIPGTVGAVPIQNVGAYGVEVRNIIEWVEVLDRTTLKERRLSNGDCSFFYRDSWFRTFEGKKVIVTRVCFRLSTRYSCVTNYSEVARELKQRNIRNPTPNRMRELILSIRNNKFPDMKKYGTAGSFFKNPTISREKAQLLLEQYPEMPQFSMPDKQVKIPLAWILDKICHLRGYREGTVGLFDNQPLVFVNYGKTTQRDVIALANKIKQIVKEKTNIIIIPEVTLL